MTEAHSSEPLTLRVAVLAERRSFVAVLVFSFIINLLGLTTSLYMLQVYDRVLSSYSIETLVALTLIAIFSLMALSALEGLRSSTIQRLGARIADKLGPQTFRAQLQGSAGLEAPSLQPLRDLETIRNALGAPAVGAFCDLPWSPIYFGLLYLLHPFLFWFALVVGLLLGLVAYINERVNVTASANAALLNLKTLQFAESAARSGEAVLAMGSAATIAARWQGRSREAVGQSLRAVERESALHALARFMRTSLQTALLGIGAALTVARELSGGGIIAGSILGSRAVAPIDAVVGSWKTVLAARQAWKRLDTAYAALGDAKSSGFSLPKPEGRVTAEAVAIALPNMRRPLFANLSFEIAPGEQLAIVGPTGSGKSTLARAIIGLVPCTAGKIRIDGAEVAAWFRQDLGKWIGYLPQAPSPLIGSIAENVARFSEANSEDVIRAAQSAGAHELILSLPQGYDTPIGSGGVRLSGGQLQRVALATALFGDPPVVVLDEPEAHLDGEGEVELRKVLQRLRERKATVIIVSHRPSAVASADKLLVLRDGQGEFGPREEMLKKIMRSANTAPPVSSMKGPATGSET